MLAISSALSMLVILPSLVSAMPLRLTGCDLSRAVLPLPATAVAGNVTLDAGEKVVNVALGVGVQNYTCVAGVYTTNMAVASLFDASCAVGTPLYTQLPPMALQAAGPSPRVAAPPSIVSKIIGSIKLGDHYFQKLAPGAVSANPVFDLRATKKGDFFAGAKAGSVASPGGAKNVAWLKLNNVQGSQAKHVFRVETAGGPPPASCTKEGEVITVKYSAMYWFTK